MEPERQQQNHLTSPGLLSHGVTVKGTGRLPPDASTYQIVLMLKVNKIFWVMFRMRTALSLHKDPKAENSLDCCLKRKQAVGWHLGSEAENGS